MPLNHPKGLVRFQTDQPFLNSPLLIGTDYICHHINERNAVYMSRSKICHAFARLLAFLLIAAVTALSFSVLAVGESMGELTENIPDSAIGGAVSRAPDSLPSTILESPSEPYASSAPAVDGNSPQPQNVTDPPDGSDQESRGLLGMVVVIMIAVALIILILSFIPTRKDRDKVNEGSDGDDTRK